MSIIESTRAEIMSAIKRTYTEIEYGCITLLKQNIVKWEGYTVNDPDMLVLDHLNPCEKRRHVSTMAHSAFSLKSLREEVEKCRVLCANHHQKHTIQQFGYKKWVDEDEA